MVSRPHRPSSRSGFTLIELAVVLAILVIVGLYGWSTMRDSLPRYRTVTAAKRLKSDLMQLRDLAVRSNRQTRLRLTGSAGDCADSDVWGGGWSLELGDDSRRSTVWDVLPPDSEVDGSDDDQSQGTADLGKDGNRQSRWVCLKDWDTISGPDSDNNDAIVFSPRGWVANPGGDFSSAGYIELTLVNQVALENGLDDSIKIRIARSGQVRLESSLGPEYSSNPVGTDPSSSR